MPSTSLTTAQDTGHSLLSGLSAAPAPAGPPPHLPPTNRLHLTHLGLAFHTRLSSWPDTGEEKPTVSEQVLVSVHLERAQVRDKSEEPKSQNVSGSWGLSPGIPILCAAQKTCKTARGSSDSHLTSGLSC